MSVALKIAVLTPSIEKFGFPTAEPSGLRTASSTRIRVSRLEGVPCAWPLVLRQRNRSRASLTLGGNAPQKAHKLFHIAARPASATTNQVLVTTAFGEAWCRDLDRRHQWIALVDGSHSQFDPLSSDDQIASGEPHRNA
jgi:hypothetical protein